MRRTTITILCIAFSIVLAGLIIYFLPRKKADTITANLANRPLPYLSTWQTKFSKEELGLAERGHAVLPNFPSSDAPGSSSYQIKTLLGAKEMGIPISLTGTQWEADLRGLPYKNLDTDGAGNFTGSTAMGSSNPNNIKEDNTVQSPTVLDPFGPASQVALWGQIGSNWSSIKPFQFLSQAYPNPSNVYLVGNNETPKIGGSGLGWPANSPTSSLRYKEAFKDTGKIAGMAFDTLMNFNNRIVGDGLIERYGALFSAWRANITNTTWKNNLKFVAYNGIGDSLFRAYDNWATGTSTHTTYQNADILPSGSTGPRASYYPYAWDGASPEVYLGTGYPQSDSRLISTDLDTMNWVFMLAEARKANPDFYFEHSIWDGYIPSCTTTSNIQPCCVVGSTCNTQDKRTVFALNGQAWSPERYAGMEQYSMWLTRPQALRQFLTMSVSWTDNLPYFLALTKVVDRVHNQPVLADFWQNGTLVENPNGKHPYQSLKATAGYSDSEIEARDGVGRWFYLNDNLDPYDADTWTVANNPTINVYSLAMTKGAAPNREWLVYTHSPKQDRTGVIVTVPGHGDITVDSTIAGNFYHIKESDGSVTEITDASATLAHLILNHENPIVAPGASLQFSATGKDQYDGDAAVGTMIWSATGGTIDSSGLFTAGATPGTYEITAQSGSVTQHFDLKISNLLAQWKFDEGSGQYVSDASSRNNACYNNSTWNTDGKFGTAGSTDGSTSISCDTDEYISTPKEFTVSAWINVNQGFGTSGNIVSTDDGSLKNGYAIRFSHNATTNISQLGIYTNNGTPVGTWQTVSIVENTWHHVTAEFKAGTFLHLYFDGQLVKNYTTNIPTAIADSSQRLILGQGWKGSIDQVRVYNQALSSTEVADLYNETVEPVLPPPPLLEQPTVDIKANGSDGPIEVASGSSVVLGWTTMPLDTACSASGGWSGDKSTTGSESTGSLTQAKSFTITCSNITGTAIDSVVVNIKNKTPLPNVTIQVNGQASVTIASDGSATLKWDSTNADACVASGDWGGTQSTSSSMVVGPLSEAKSYILTCTNETGSVQAQAMVCIEDQLLQPTPAPVTTAPTTITPVPTLNLSKDSFSTGWNMVSFPDLSSIITSGNLLPDTFKIRRYDGASNSYTKGEDTDILLTPGTGYWLKIDDTNKIANLRYIPNPVSSTEITTTKGWNLLGNPYQSDLPLANLTIKHKDGSSKSYSDAIADKEVSGYAWNWEASSRQYLFIAINPDNYTTSAHKQTVINPFRGFWLIVKSDLVSSIILNK